MFSVLILDDNRPIATHIQNSIRWEDIECQVVAVLYDGISGKKAIERFKPDIIISDIEMPGMSGLQMIEMTQNCIPNSKFIFISAYERFAYAHQALKFKACDYLIKPFTQSELRRAVDEALAELKKYEYFPETESNYTPLMKSVLEYLENAAYSSVTLEMAAEHFNMSSSKLGRMIKKETDMRYADLVTGIRLRRAKELLTVPYLNISDIADRVGYSDYLTFYKVFVKNEKMSPSEYRKNMSNGKN